MPVEKLKTKHLIRKNPAKNTRSKKVYSKLLRPMNSGKGSMTLPMARAAIKSIRKESQSKK